MARKRRSVNNPTLSLIHYINKTKTMGKAYDESKAYRVGNFSTGFQALKAVQNAWKQIIDEVVDELYKNTGDEQYLAFVGQLKVDLLKIGVSYLKLTNEGYSGYSLTNELSAIATKIVNDIMYSTPFSCDEIVDVINKIFAKYVNVEPFAPSTETYANMTVCNVKPANPLPPAPIKSETGYTAPLTTILTSKSPEEVIQASLGGSSGGA